MIETPNSDIPLDPRITPAPRRVQQPDYQIPEEHDFLGDFIGLFTVLSFFCSIIGVVFLMIGLCSRFELNWFAGVGGGLILLFYIVVKFRNVIVS